MKLEKYTVTEEQARWAGIREWCPPDPGDYVRLLIDGELYMSDTKFEYYTNRNFLRNAHGDVMIAGLGIGLVIKNLMTKILNGTITSITIYEKYRDVIDLVWPTVKSWVPEDFNFRCIEADILEYIPADGEKYDTIYFDIWPSICSDNHDDMVLLHKRWARRKNKGGWMDSWMKRQVYDMWNREPREERRWASFR